MISAKDVPANARILTVSVDGELVELRDGETIYEVAERCRREVPTLCYDPRLEAFGSCRLCVVEVEGIKNPVASCTECRNAVSCADAMRSSVGDHRASVVSDVTVKRSSKPHVAEQNNGCGSSMPPTLRKQNA